MKTGKLLDKSRGKGKDKGDSGTGGKQSYLENVDTVENKMSQEQRELWEGYKKRGLTLENFLETADSSGGIY